MSGIKPRILLLGGSGQVGWELQRSLCSLGEVVAPALDGTGLVVDLADVDSLVSAVNAVRPQILVNAAAYTAVDKAEQEPELAHSVNAVAPAVLGELAARQGFGVVHFSTDYVFAGDASRPYRERDPTGPRSVYGRTKLDGDMALLASGAQALIFRTSWVYGMRGHNFLLTMLRLFREREELRVVDDQIGTPTWSRMLAEVTGQVVARAVCGDLSLADVKGVYHVTAAGHTSWYGFAQAILHARPTACRLVPIATADYPTPAARPAYSVLDNRLLAEVFRLYPPDWRHSLAQCLED